MLAGPAVTVQPGTTGTSVATAATARTYRALAAIDRQLSTKPISPTARASAQPSVSRRGRLASVTARTGSSPRLWKVTTVPASSRRSRRSPSSILRLRTPRRSSSCHFTPCSLPSRGAGFFGGSPRRSRSAENCVSSGGAFVLDSSFDSPSLANLSRSGVSLIHSSPTAGALDLRCSRSPSASPRFAVISVPVYSKYPASFSRPRRERTGTEAASSTLTRGFDLSSIIVFSRSSAIFWSNVSVCAVSALRSSMSIEAPPSFSASARACSMARVALLSSSWSTACSAVILLIDSRSRRASSALPARSACSARRRDCSMSALLRMSRNWSPAASERSAANF